jgi:hypothetical protein
MQELVSSVITLLPSLFGGVLGAAFLFYIRDVWLYSRRTKKQRRRDLVQRKLEKLYSPLFMLLKQSEFIISDKEPKLYLNEEGEKYFDSMILNYGYLADDELMKLLPRFLGAAFHDSRNKEMVRQTVNLILSGYSKLREEYVSE